MDLSAASLSDFHPDTHVQEVASFFIRRYLGVGFSMQGSALSGLLRSLYIGSEEYSLYFDKSTLFFEESSYQKCSESIFIL